MRLIRVMPIWIVERKRPGVEVSASAAAAPRWPAEAIACSRGLRAETIASSDIANSPLSETRARMIGISAHGNGGRGGAVNGIDAQTDIDRNPSPRQPYDQLRVRTYIRRRS